MICVFIIKKKNKFKFKNDFKNFIIFQNVS